MAKQVFERNKPHVNVGTIGHIDHAVRRCLPWIQYKPYRRPKAQLLHQIRADGGT